jgi:guanine nucleotide-binding protein subunit gamma, fungi
MAAYELRSGGDVKNKKQSVADLKYRRLQELNGRLKEDLDRPRVKVSEAAISSVILPLSTFSPVVSSAPGNQRQLVYREWLPDWNRLINYCNNTRDFMVPSVWGQVFTASLRVPNT